MNPYDKAPQPSHTIDFEVDEELEELAEQFRIGISQAKLQHNSSTNHTFDPALPAFMCRQAD